MDENDLLNYHMMQLPQEKRGQFMLFCSSKLKNPSVALGFCFFLGGLGAHHFYLGNTGKGLVYALLCWTFIPGIFALFECFFIKGATRKQNAQVIQQALAMVG